MPIILEYIKICFQGVEIPLNKDLIGVALFTANQRC